MTEQELLNSYFKKEEAQFKDYLFKLFFQQELKATEFKSLQMSSDEAKEQIEEYLKAYKGDLRHGMELLLDQTKGEQQERVLAIRNKIFSYAQYATGIGQVEQLTQEDYDFLADIARNDMSQHIDDASCIFRFIIQLNPAYSSAWVGWAMCEQEQGHQQMADAIYELALAVNPRDYLLRYYCAVNELAAGRKDQASTILQEMQLELGQSGFQDTSVYQNISILLEKIKLASTK